MNWDWESDCISRLRQEWTSFCLRGQTPLPLQMSATGQSLSSTSGPGHWLSSSPETARPESRSKQARKRFWIETILMPLINSAWEGLCCREEEGTHGEQKVHSDHSLRMTERSKERARTTGWRRYSRQSFSFILCYYSLHCACLPSHSLVSHCKVPSWQRLENRTEQPRNTFSNWDIDPRWGKKERISWEQTNSGYKEKQQRMIEMQHTDTDRVVTSAGSYNTFTLCSCSF